MNIYSPQPNDILAPGTLVAGVQNQMQGFLKACGEFAGAVFAAIQTGGQTSSAYANSLVDVLHAQRLAGPQGDTTLRGLATGLTETGVPSTVVDNWRQAIAQWLGRGPVVLLFQNAQALPGESPGLLGHFATVTGFSPSTNKFVVADPNSPASKAGGFSLYSLGDLIRARPVGAVVPDTVGGGGIDPNTPVLGGLSQLPGVQAANRALYQGRVRNPATDLTGNVVAAGLTGAGDTFLKALGLSSTKDLGYRMVLIGVGGMVVLVAIAAIVRSGMQETSQTAGNAAPLIAATAG